MQYFCGIEGGGTKSTCVITDANGTIIGFQTGPATNQWLIGLEECAVRLIALIDATLETLSNNSILGSAAAKNCRDAEGRKGCIFSGIGLMLSGIDLVDEQQRLETRLRSLRPELTERYLLKNDTFAPLGMTSHGSGIVLICGTGSNCRGMTSDGSTETCGGWGHLLGDEAGAYQISLYVIKEIFRRHDMFGGKSWDNDDSTMRVTSSILKYFDVTSLKGLLAVFYRDFSKDRIAGFCGVAAELARDYSDPLCVLAFEVAGRDIADMMLGVLTSLSMSFPMDGSPLPVICVGSVWNSHELLKDGIVSRLKEASFSNFQFLRVNTSCAIGAAHLVAQQFGHRFSSLSENTQVLFQC
eukprot:ANDGO_00563.mRNA.1 N-acetyl-D-glucosamine kinase